MMRNAAELTRRILYTRGYVRIPSRDESLAPLIRPGDICHFEPVRNFRELKKGDVLLYVTERGDLVSRRLVGTAMRNGETCLILRGDGAKQPKEEVAVSQVLGKMRPMGFGMKLWGLMAAHFPFAFAWVKKWRKFEWLHSRK